MFSQVHGDLTRQRYCSFSPAHAQLFGPQVESTSNEPLDGQDFAFILRAHEPMLKSLGSTPISRPLRDFTDNEGAFDGSTQLLSANCLTSSTTGVFADLVSGEKRGNITFASDSPVQVIPWEEADSQLFASPAAYGRDPYGSHFSAVPNSGRSSNPDTCAIHVAPEK